MLAGCASPLADSPEANAELKRLVQEHANKGYDHWRRAMAAQQDIHVEVTGPSGQRYQVDVDPVWDDEPNGVIRVIVCIDDFGSSAYRPLCDGALLSSSEAR